MSFVAGGGCAGGLPLCSRCFVDVPWIHHAEIRCPVCGRTEACPDCPRRADTAFVCNRSAVKYTSEMKGWLSRLKYRGDERLTDLFAAMLGGALERLMAEYGFRRRDIRCLTCVPLSEVRLAERGFNQTERIARRLATLYRLPYLPLLDRVRHTGKMSQKSRSERLSQLEGAFRGVNQPERAPRLFAPRRNRSFRIVLIDDVYTTGSTMQACARALRETWSGTEIYGLTWAR